MTVPISGSKEEKAPGNALRAWSRSCKSHGTIEM